MYCQNCKDQFRLEPRTGMDPGPKSPNNKFIKSERKSQSEFKIKILIDSIKWKELHILTCKKHPRTCPNNMIDSEKFFLFIVVFLQPFLSLLSCFFLFFFLFPFGALYTTVFTQISPPTCESDAQSFSVPFRTSLILLLLAIRLLVHCSGITSTLMRPESQLSSI